MTAQSARLLHVHPNEKRVNNKLLFGKIKKLLTFVLLNCQDEQTNYVRRDFLMSYRNLYLQADISRRNSLVA